MIAKRSYIWIKTQFEGYHFYPNAPNGVSFLKNVHRHLFKVKVWVQVLHSDRELEFFAVKKFIDSKLKGFRVDTKSCEMVCDYIHAQLMLKYGMHRSYRVSVSEDGENGAEKWYGSNQPA